MYFKLVQQYLNLQLQGHISKKHTKHPIEFGESIFKAFAGLHLCVDGGMSMESQATET